MNDLKPSWVRDRIAWLVREYRRSKADTLVLVLAYLLLFGTLATLVGVLLWIAPLPVIGVVLVVVVVWRVLAFLDRNWP